MEPVVRAAIVEDAVRVDAAADIQIMRIQLLGRDGSTPSRIKGSIGCDGRLNDESTAGTVERERQQLDGHRPPSDDVQLSENKPGKSDPEYETKNET